MIIRYGRANQGLACGEMLSCHVLHMVRDKKSLSPCCMLGHAFGLDLHLNFRFNVF